MMNRLWSSWYEMICRGQLDQKLGGEGEGWGVQENKLVLAGILGLGVIAGWATPHPH